MYAVVRTDLGLSPSQLAIQASHAFVGAYASHPRRDIYDVQEGTKVLLRVDNAQEFVDLQRALSKAKIPFWTAIEGPPCAEELVGVPTALGIGPVRKSTARPVLGNLKLLR